MRIDNQVDYCKHGDESNLVKESVINQEWKSQDQKTKNHLLEINDR